jgi:hypothetical protein
LGFRYKINAFGLDIKKLVEKVFLWYYEFEYPNKYFDSEDINKVMLENINNNSCNELEWCDLFNYKKFYYLLLDREKTLLDKPKFPNIVDLSPGSSNHFHVDDVLLLLLMMYGLEGKNQGVLCRVESFLMAKVLEMWKKSI